MAPTRSAVRSPWAPVSALLLCAVAYMWLTQPRGCDVAPHVSTTLASSHSGGGGDDNSGGSHTAPAALPHSQPPPHVPPRSPPPPSRLPEHEAPPGAAARHAPVAPPDALAGLSPAARKLRIVWDCMATAERALDRPSAASRDNVLPLAAWWEYVYAVNNLTAPLRGLPWHTWAGFSGPWIEDSWVQYAAPRLGMFYPFVPLLAQWTDSFVNFYDPAVDALKKRMFRDGSLRDDVIYVTVSQHDRADLACDADGSVYRQVLYFSAAGWGHAAVPLLKGQHGLVEDGAPRATMFTFVGTVSDARAELLAVFKWSTLPQTPTYLRSLTSPDWFSEVKASVFALSLRGFGRQAFRTAELLQYGRIPVLLSDDVVWTPYGDWRHLRDGVADGRSSLWGPNGVGFVVYKHQVYAFVCIACEFLLPGSAARYAGVDALDLDGVAACPCTTARWEAIAATLGGGDVTRMVLPPTSVAYAMEQRLRSPAVAALFTNDGAVAAMAAYLDDPDPATTTSAIVCGPKPAAYGTPGEHC